MSLVIMGCVSRWYSSTRTLIPGQTHRQVSTLRPLSSHYGVTPTSSRFQISQPPWKCQYHTQLPLATTPSLLTSRPRKLRLWKFPSMTRKIRWLFWWIFRLCSMMRKAPIKERRSPLVRMGRSTLRSFLFQMKILQILMWATLIALTFCWQYREKMALSPTIQPLLCSLML